ncbi:PREDICTED: uncharacterized protein LOC108532054 [Rhinopithecus bieti]|uniref:uncharacterized protein LOC108532054 n=1 Tax=Rhinopithecus bieti TaxID=61621 RepID=UPI00083BB405|nr:PREDICTED: uncharacterized protein LOC108532054 [Rhinopithecus bieti]
MVQSGQFLTWVPERVSGYFRPPSPHFSQEIRRRPRAISRSGDTIFPGATLPLLPHSVPASPKLSALGVLRLGPAFGADTGAGRVTEPGDDGGSSTAVSSERRLQRARVGLPSAWRASSRRHPATPRRPSRQPEVATRSPPGAERLGCGVPSKSRFTARSQLASLSPPTRSHDSCCRPKTGRL